MTGYQKEECNVFLTKDRVLRSIRLIKDCLVGTKRHLEMVEQVVVLPDLMVLSWIGSKILVGTARKGWSILLTTGWKPSNTGKMLLDFCF